MKIERIWYSEMAKKILHVSSSEVKRIDFKKKGDEVGMGILAYVEKYIDESGFELFDQLNGIMFTLIKK